MKCTVIRVRCRWIWRELRGDHGIWYNRDMMRVQRGAQHRILFTTQIEYFDTDMVYWQKAEAIIQIVIAIQTQNEC
jgi:hypothetical protein